MSRAPDLLILLALLAASWPAGARTLEQGSVVVMDLVPERGMDPSAVRILNGVLLNEIGRSNRFRHVIGQQDIMAMVRMEEERIKLTGCVDDACLADIGGALGVEYMIAGEVGRLDEDTVLNLKLMNVKQARVDGRTSILIAADEGGMLSAMKRAVREVVLDPLPPLETPSDPTEETPGDPTEETPADPTGEAPGDPVVETPGDAAGAAGPRSETAVAPWVTLGLTLAAGVAGGAVAGLAYSDHAAMDEELRGTPAWSDLKTSTESKSLAADVLFGVAGAAAVATIVLFVVGSVANDEDPPPAEARLVPLRGGGAASLILRFD